MDSDKPEGLNITKNQTKQKFNIEDLNKYINLVDRSSFQNLLYSDPNTLGMVQRMRKERKQRSKMKLQVVNVKR